MAPAWQAGPVAARPTLVEARDPHGRPIYWIGPAGQGQDAGPGTDFAALAAGKVAVTPLKASLPQVSGIRLTRNFGHQAALLAGLTAARGDAVIMMDGDGQHPPSCLPRFIEEWAREQLAADASLAWVVCGHSHLPAIVEVAPGRRYVNAGDWLTHRSFIVVRSEGAPELRVWEAEA